MPIAFGIIASAAAHEIGHRAVAARNGAKLGPPFFIPNGSLGTFGAVTQIKSLLKGRAELFDIAIAGPAAGGAVALALFLFGLAASAAGGGGGEEAAAAAGLVPVPSQLFQGSLLLGGISSAVLETGAKQARESPSPMLTGPASCPC